ncbi:hypothetical protein KPH14_006367 [Odynerus spinipes]|uniref:Uncharacterized protein n=1 Tax=Odynerus spinipes TaxID=1348599 RepID=A0AAD9RZ56_9HYME|nr:hypothetical protein KPH14_006367 [Odynerus spinipes]
MESNAPSNRVRRASGTYSERVIFYVDDLSVENCQNSTPELYYRAENAYGPSYRSSSDCLRLDDRSALYPPAPDNICLELDDRFALYPSTRDEGPRRHSTCSQAGTTRRSSRNLEVETRSSRRSSVQSGRSRTNSSSRPTPLGDGRRASISKKNRQRRSGANRRKDSVRPAKTEAIDARKVLEDEQETEQTRRHRRIAMIVLGTFLFLLAASVLVVVVTLTHSSFHSPPTGSKELAQHRAQHKSLDSQGERGAAELPEQGHVRAD